jgi:hypothetical protein
VNIEVLDNFLSNPEHVRASALRSGFGTWWPNKGDIGADSYGGVNFVGDHVSPLTRLYRHLGRQIIPSSMFFRITNPSMEHALIHSDREYGENTAILYLSPNNPVRSGTGFYRHRETGMTEMPPLDELMKDPVFFQKIRQQMLDADEHDWELYQFVESAFNRCLIFNGPKIHCRIPKTGFGSTEDDSRAVWVCHFNFL